MKPVKASQFPWRHSADQRAAVCFQPSLTVFSCTTQFVILNKKHSYFLWFIFAERKHFQRRACAASVKVRVFIRVRQALRFHLYGPLINWSRGSDVSFSEIEVHVSEKVNWNERVENSLRRSLQKSLCTPKSPVLSLNSWVPGKHGLIENPVPA